MIQKTIGLLGGMSWESTASYYKIINESVKQKLGGLHSAKILLYSVDFDEIERCQASADWETGGRILSEAAKNLETAGADCIALCTNTMHKVAPLIEANISIPFLHIADVTAGALKQAGISCAALLGTAYTMEQNFYKERFIQNGIDILIPDAEDRKEVNRIIFEELCLGLQSGASRKRMQTILNQLAESGAQGAILGCTEIGLLIRQQDACLPVFDTAEIHAKAIAEFAVTFD